MKALIVSMDMLPGTERLMPWRTVVEVAKYLSAQPDIDGVEIYSGETPDTVEPERTYDGVRIVAGGKDAASIAAYARSTSVGALFYPFAFRDIFKPLDDFSSLEIKKVAYIPGGIYPMAGVRALAAQGLYSAARPYLIENAVPRGIMLEKLAGAGFSHIISFSPYTAAIVVKYGWPAARSVCALPGLDGFGSLEPDYSAVERLGLQDSKFVLFSGAPAEVRGSGLLLKAYPHFLKANSDARLVMLMRTDRSSSFARFNEALERLPDKSRLTVDFERLTPAQLKGFFMKARAVVLPFIIIPSEIPLTYFEVMACGTPVVTFHNGGTTHYLSEAILTVPSRTPKSLAGEMARVCNDDHLHRHLCDCALKLSSNHPDWAQSAQIWKTTLQ
ncbi:MAG: glycosyltransferase [Muribaculaceae bacterium]|nr:glycosyltransferase [Muribaculaceae bacterium]